MRLLILGGTKFLGRHAVEAALERGHDVTLFNRGQTNPELFPEAEKLHGDRDGDLDALRGRTWDAVVDTSGYYPRVVEQSVDLLRDAVPQYLFVSSVSAYADLSTPPDEDAPTSELPPDATESLEFYGPLKAECERVVQRAYGDAATIVRPGLIVGPHDPTGRFTYWPHRIARGGDVLAPGPPDEPVTLVDVRDLGDWIVRLCEETTPGVYNAIERTTWGELLEACVRGTDSTARLVWIPGGWLLEQGVGEWMELPLWLASPDSAGGHRVDNTHALAAGLTFRPLEDTARATLVEARTTDGAGLRLEREAELLTAWSSLASGS